MLVFQFPDGQCVNFSQGLTFSVNGTSPVQLSWTGSVTGSYNVGTNTNATLILNAILNGIIGAITNGATGVVNVSPLPILISTCVPATFTPAGGLTLDIYGNGFYPNMNNGLLWVEDAAGGADSNSTSFTVVYDTPQHLVATWASNGDSGALTTNCIVYFQDVSNVISNLLFGITTV